MTKEEKTLDKLKGPEFVLAIDCVDCGRTLAYKNHCGKCGGDSWLPVGYFDRRVMKKLFVQWIASGSTDVGDLSQRISELRS